MINEIFQWCVTAFVFFTVCWVRKIQVADRKEFLGSFVIVSNELDRLDEPDCEARWSAEDEKAMRSRMEDERAKGKPEAMATKQIVVETPGGGVMSVPVDPKTGGVRVAKGDGKIRIAKTPP